MINPLHYIGNADAKNASHWRIRHGTKDKDTSLAIPATIALSLGKHNVDVDFELAWERPHSGDYDLEELFDWAEQVSKRPAKR